MGKRTDMTLRPVVGERHEGRRVYITLHCGHERLHNPAVPVPDRARCHTCPPLPLPPPREGPPLTCAERGRLGGLAGGRPRKGKYPGRMPWWEQGLRDLAEANSNFPLDDALQALREKKYQRR